MTDRLSPRRLNRATLARQMLLAREAVPVVGAVERLGGLQAQEPRPPFVALWTRIADFDREQLAAALRERRLVRATSFRATLHLMSAADYLALRGLLQPVLTQALRALGDRAAGLEIDQVLPAARRLFAEAPRTFDEVRNRLVEQFPTVDDRALGYVTRMCLPLVMVPTDDRWGFPSNAAFALADEWLGATPRTDTPREHLVLRYLGAFGPATPGDAQEWSGLQGLRPTFEALRPRLRTFRDERGRELFDLPDAPRPDEEVDAPARFLPDFDSLVLAHADRTRVLADEHRGKVATRNLRINATFLVDGFAAGTWRIERKRGTATLRASPFAPLPAGAPRALGDEGERLLRFVEPDATSFDVRLE